MSITVDRTEKAGRDLDLIFTVQSTQAALRVAQRAADRAVERALEGGVSLRRLEKPTGLSRTTISKRYARAQPPEWAQREMWHHVQNSERGSQ